MPGTASRSVGPAASTRRGVAEMTLCYMIGLCRHILFSAQGLRDRQDWEKMGGTELSGRTVGIIGVGFIGKELIDLLKPFNCEILVNDIIDQTAYYRQHGPHRGQPGRDL